MNIQEIPLDELRNDRAASLQDITVCKLALLHGHKVYGGNRSVHERLEVNEKIVAVIDGELKRRKAEND